METQARYTLVGSFVLAAILAAFAFVYWLQNVGGLADRQLYKVRFQSSVSGLLKGSSVLFNGIRVVNLNNASPKSGWDHPHVQAGQPCLGNLREGFEKLLGECTLVPLVAMLLQFLETYTPATAYCSIDLWATT